MKNSKRIILLTLIVNYILIGCDLLDTLNPNNRDNYEVGKEYSIVDNENHHITMKLEYGSLYFYVDCLNNTTDNFLDSWPSDTISFYFDVNQNGRIDENIDVAYGISSSKTLCNQYLIDSTTSTFCGAFPTSAVLTHNFTQSSDSSDDHVIWDFSVPFKEVSSNNSVHVTIHEHDPDYGWIEYPENQNYIGYKSTTFPTTYEFSWK